MHEKIFLSGNVLSFQIFSAATNILGIGQAGPIRLIDLSCQSDWSHQSLSIFKSRFSNTVIRLYFRVTDNALA